MGLHNSSGCQGGETIRRKTESGIAGPADRAWVGNISGDSEGSHRPLQPCGPQMCQDST